MANNHLPPQGGPIVNAIEDVSNDYSIEDVKNVKTPLKELHARLVESGLIKKKHDDCGECVAHMEGFLWSKRMFSS